jgi:hypothetical protein
LPLATGVLLAVRAIRAARLRGYLNIREVLEAAGLED